MKFTKMQGLGNDYIYINCFEEQVTKPEELAVQLSDRHFGVGSDGLILICPSEVADFKMQMYNSDGSHGEMCGNGIRCIGKYVYDYGLTEKEHISVETLAGIKELDLLVEEGKVVQVRVDMGSPIFVTKDFPVCMEHESVINRTIKVKGLVFHLTCVSMGNPHAVIFLEENEVLPDRLEELALKEIGPGFEHHEIFPNRINTEFVKVIDQNTVQMRVWERGSGETMACGTGACAVAVACILHGFTEDKVTVRLLGGDLEIEWDREKNTVYMTGAAVTVFDGEIRSILESV
ncbi:MAG: diaminopimelate epimerase [Lachnospiraceae bacterium]|nr:diaminopimelate epimerase [Lachnospiraceae bacterium]